MDKNKTLVIIPLRANSQRLPNKNLRDLKGLPLFMHSVNYARNNDFQQIIISTDGEKIKDLAIENNVQVIDRPNSLATSTTPTISVLQDVLEKSPTSYENIVLLQATNPLRPKTLLQEAFETFIKGNYDSLVTVSRNYYKLGTLSQHKFKPYNYNIGQRSQDLEPLYFENGLLYITKTSFIKKGILVADNHYAFEVNHPFATVDIDEALDFKYAEFILENYPNE